MHTHMPTHTCTYAHMHTWHEGKYLFLIEKVLFHMEIHKIVKGNDAYKVIKYQEFCSLHSLKQLIKSPTRITENKS